ncbi:hypothetical protein EDEG_00603 [Edhazardia aedis USNM 41457]|uniref:Thioredoxin domain-containing protein n=1 Tax=Edhazardia aedis (strain USNM 41457) TaxID=1003232 RepID=J9DVN3_EDHAE|nr:hypothetical protein EDEG_00603 [Edhazardia aedis USNM 41457]|eukprot:EJW05347.1 hypothetical protein EDEG_00603 [Edhazardia aedis USNM 41457]
MIGQKAPSFDLPSFADSQITTTSLNSIKEDYVIIVFYPHDFTFVCPTEIMGFSMSEEEIKELNSTVLFVSVDSVFVHKAWMNVHTADGGIQGNVFPMLADVTRNMSREYKMLNEEAGVNYRGTVILDKERKIRYYAIYDNLVGRSVQETLRIVRNLKKMDDDKNVNFCPCEIKS